MTELESLRETLITVARERDELQQTLDLQQSRVTVITKEWQKAHGKPNVLPDLGMLIDWMWGQTKVCEFLMGSHQSLVNRKYTQGLTAEETEELNGLEGTLDDMDKPFYEGVLKRVRALLKDHHCPLCGNQMKP
jgi:hypothetical protein